MNVTNLHDLLNIANDVTHLSTLGKETSYDRLYYPLTDITYTLFENTQNVV